MKILLVDDDEIFAQGVVSGLSGEGFAVDTLTDAAKAASRLKIHKDTYDLLIFDMMLPVIEGPQLCRIVREQGIKAPILMLSGKTDPSDKVAALDSGADDYMTKPFSLAELTARLRALLRRPKEVRPTELTVGDISLNCENRTVFRKGKKVELTLKEFSLLEYFMRHPDQVLLRDRILDHVWDFSFSSFSNVIDVHINSLRKKLRLGKNSILETVRGVGYRMKSI